MQITKYSSAITQTVEEWAESNGYSIDDRKTQGSIHLAKEDHGFELIAEDGFAYIHGEGALNGVGTTIMDMEDFETAIAGLLKRLS